MNYNKIRLKFRKECEIAIFFKDEKKGKYGMNKLETLNFDSVSKTLIK